MEQPPDSRHLVGAAATLTVQLRDQDGAAADAVGTVTVAVTNLAGTSVAMGAVTETVGLCSASPSSIITAPDRLTAVWTDNSVARATTVHEIVGGYYFTLAELQAAEGVQTALANSPDVTAELRQARHEIEELIEWSTGTAWVRRAARVTLSTGTTSEIVVPHFFPRSLTALSLDGASQTAADFQFAGQYLVRDSGQSMYSSLPNGVDIQYVHGYDAPPPRLRRAALDGATRFILEGRTNTLSPRASQWSQDGIAINLARQDKNHPTGYADIDAVIARYRRRRPGIAA